MNQDVVVGLMQSVFVLILKLAVPILFVSVVIGLTVSIFQTVTQIQEATLTYVPKILGGVITLIIIMPWMINIFVSSVKELFESIPTFL